MKTARFDAALWALTLAQTLGAAFLLGRKWRRYARRHDSYEWDLARWRGEWLQEPTPGWSAKSGPHLAFYADGFAETRLATQLGRALEKERSDWRFSLAVRNLKDARAGHALPADWPVSALPYDYFPAVRNWFQTTKPDGVVMIEKLFYPNFVRGAASLGAKIVGVNSYARASDCAKNPAFKRWILRGFSRLGLRSPSQENHLAPLLEAGVFGVTGSLKFPAPREVAAPLDAELETWLALAGGRALIAAGSVEAGEIEVLCEAFSLFSSQNQATLLWAPRHIETARELQSRLEKRGFRAQLRSEKVKPEGEVEVLILDSMGELGALYARCEGAFVGGTFAGGGHNVLEPLAGGVPVVFGPKRGFFAAEQEMCEQNGVGFAVQNAAELAGAWQKMIEDETYRAQVRERIAVFIAQGRTSWNATLQLLLDEFDAMASGAMK